MLNRLAKIVDKYSQSGTVALLFIFTLGLIFSVNVLDLPISLPALAKISGGATILDLEFYYQSHDVYQRLTQLGPEGRRLYLIILWSFDLILPAAYALALATASQMAWRHWYNRLSLLRLFVFLPLFAGGIDYMENGTISYLLLTYPEPQDTLANLAGYLTAAKTLTGRASVVVVLLGAAAQTARQAYYRFSAQAR